MVEVEGIFLSSDGTDLITESFARRFTVDLSSWIKPFGYFEERSNSVLCDGPLPDGTYLLIGWSSYPGKQPLTNHQVYQFALVKSRGVDLILERPLNTYPDRPDIPLNSVYPLFRVGTLKDYREARKVYNKVISKHLTIDDLKQWIEGIETDGAESRILRIRLALQRHVDRERLI